ncbi:MAG: hypothetical protein J6O73_15510 [Lachnospiraceae bacterium]|nr:hypothetical protein [Lachnospiraceae bacterium]
MVLKEKTTFDTIATDMNHWFPDRIKFCLDRKRRVMALDREMHIEMEHELYDDGSDYKDIFGGDILTDANEIQIIWEAHPNIERNRDLGIGAGRELTDQAIIEELTEIVREWIL